MADDLFEDVINRLADEQTLQEEIVAEGDKNSLRREALASTYSLYGDALRAGAAITGSESLRRKADYQARAAELEMERSTLPQSYTEVEGVGDALGYVGHLAAQSAPYLPLLAAGGGVGGIATRGLGLAAGSLGARATVAGGAALATYPSEVGAKLSEQTESGQEESLLKAATLAAPSAALNVVGGEAAILGKAVGRQFGKSAARITTRAAAEEAAAELGQQLLTQVNKGDLTSEEAIQSYKEAIVGGGLLGGLAGGARGVYQQRKANKILEQKAEELRKQMERASTGELDTVVGSTPEEEATPPPPEELRRLGYEPKLEEGPLTTPREDYEFDSERMARGEGVAFRNRAVDKAIKDKVAARRQIEGPREADVEQTEALDVTPEEEFQRSGIATGATPETYRIASPGTLLGDATRQLELKSNRALGKLKAVANRLVEALDTQKRPGKMDYFKDSQTVAQIFKDAREELQGADLVESSIKMRERALDIMERRIDQFLSVRAKMFGIDVDSVVEPTEGPTITDGKRAEQKTVAPEGKTIALAPEPSAIPATREEMQKVPEVSQEQQTVRDLEQTIEPTALELLKRYIDKPNVSEKQAQGIVSTMLRRKLTDDEMSYLNFTKILKDVEKQEAEAKAKAEAEAEKARQEGQAIPYVKPKKSPAQAAPKTEPEAQAAPPTSEAKPAAPAAPAEAAPAPETSKAPARPAEPTVLEKYKAAVAANRERQLKTRKKQRDRANAQRRRDASKELDANVKLLETQQQVEAELAAEKKAAADAKAARNAEIQAKRKATIARKKAEAETAAEVKAALEEAKAEKPKKAEKAEKPKKKQPTRAEVIKADAAKRKEQMADVLKKVKKGDTTQTLAQKTIEAAKDMPEKVQNYVVKMLKDGRVDEAWDLVQRMKNPDVHGSSERIVAERSGPRPTPEQVTARVSQIVKGWISPPKTLVMDSRNLPAWLQKQVERAGWRPGEEGIGVDGLFTSDPDGKPVVVVFSDKARDLAHVDRIMMHEGMGHYGLRRRFGTRVIELLQSMYASNADFKRYTDEYIDSERRRAAIVEGLLPGTKEFDEWMNTSRHKGGDIAERTYAMEEVVAHMAEDGAPTFGFYEKVRAILRDIGRKMNFVKNWTNSDVLWLMRKANLSVTRGAGFMSSEVNAERGTLASAVQYQKWTMENYVKGVEKEVEALTGVPMGKSSLASDVTERFKAYEAMGVAESARNYMATATAIAQKGLLSAMFSRQLYSYIERKNLLKGIKEYAQAAKDKDVIARQLSEEAAIIAEKSQALGEKADPVLDMLRKHTIEGNWADARLIPPDSTEKVNLDAAREFNKLEPKQKELYFSMIKHNQKLKQRIIDNLTKQINDEEKLKLAEAKDDAAKERVRSRTKEYRDALTRDFARLKGPYMPLARFGNYVMVGRSAEMKAIDKQIQSLEEGELNAETRKELTKLRDKRDTMRGQAEHYYMSMHESAGKAREAKLQLEQDKQFSNLEFEDAFEKEGAFSRGHGPRWADIENIRARVKSLTTSDVNDADARAEQSEIATRINRVLTELYLNTLAETSARRHNLPRSGVAGASKDMMRAFIRKAKSDAGFISTMETNDKIVKSMDALRKSTTADATGVDGTRDERKKAYNEVLKRHYQSMEYTETPIQDKLMAASSFYMLLSSPRYFLMNLSQAPLVSVPYMGGRYGMGRSFKEWSKAAGEVYKVMSKDWKAAGRGEFNIKDMKGLTEKEKEFLQKLQDDGLMDIGINSELGSWDVSSDNLISNYTQGAMQRLQNVARQVEVMNRVSSGLAAFRMSGSTAYGFDVVNRTHFDYTKNNAPSFYNKWPKVLTQFRKYQLGQIAMFGGLLREAFTEADPKERWIAKKILFNTMSTAAFFTGAMSLPAVSALFFLSDVIFGDEDDPFDTEEALRKMIGNETLANFILKGTMAGAAGVDLSGSIGYAQMASFAPFSDLKMGSRDELYKTMGSLAGPWAGMAGSMADGYGLISSGDTYKGVELMMPGLLKSGMRAYREEAEGITRRNGDVVLSKEDISVLHTLWTGLGFRSTDADKIGRYRSMLYQYEEAYKSRVARIKKDFMYAKANNDTKGMKEAREHWQKVQESKIRNGFKPNKLSDLLSAPEKQKKREYKYQQEVRRLGGF